MMMYANSMLHRRFWVSHVFLLIIISFSIVTYLYLASLDTLFGDTFFRISARTQPELEKILTTGPPGLIENYHPFCGPYKLSDDPKHQNDFTAKASINKNSSCKVLQADNPICDSMMDHFFELGPIAKCPMKESVDFCKIVDKDNFKLSCDFAACKTPSLYGVGIIEPAIGQLKWYHFRHTEIGEEKVSTIALKALKNENPFMFICCSTPTSHDTFWQLLVLPYASSLMAYEPSIEEKINVNMVLIDSVSRPHFYRQLPNTIEYLKKLRTLDETEVLDFELFHSLKDRTFENLYALFTGKHIHISDTYEGIAVPPLAVNFRSMLKNFKRAGYDTLYQEDLCWEYHWGLIRNTGVYRLKLPFAQRFRTFSETIRNHSIDDLGVTHSSCEIFRTLGIIDPFQGPPQACYAGKFQHDYLLKYLQNAINEKRRNPLFSFAVLNVGHEGSGRRIRTFDDSLRNFLISTQNSDNTIHILFADHGNSYGPYSLTLEGRLEIFHPFMFMLVPKKVANRIGEKRMAHLRENQHRLFTLQDIHDTLHTLLEISEIEKISRNFVKPKLGLFGVVSNQRNCDDINLLRGTLCYCEDWRTSLPVTSVHYLISEYVLEKINKKIARTYLEFIPSKRVCQQLVGVAVTNVWRKRKKKRILIGMDITVQKNEVFSAEVYLKIDDALYFDMKINSLQRQTSYGKYRECANRKVPLRYCVCSFGDLVVEARMQPGASIGMMFDVQTTSRPVHHDCLYLLTREYKAGVVFEASNACWNVSYSLEIHFELKNMKRARNYGETTVPPGSVRNLAIIIMDFAGFQWKYEYTLKFSEKNLKT